MIFHSYLISNRQFQDVVKNFSDLLYFENEASYEKVLFYTFELFFHVESFSLLSYVYHQLRIYYEQNKRELPREIWKTSLLFFCPVSDTWKYRTNAGIETQPFLPFSIHSRWLCVSVFQRDTSSPPILSSPVRIVYFGNSFENYYVSCGLLKNFLCNYL